MRKIVILLPLVMLGGCVSTAKTIVMAPVHVVSKGADWATTSQDEADRNRGREMRKQEKRDEKARKRAEEEQRRAAERGN